MKRKIAIMLAAVMTTAMLPLNVMAYSTNSVDSLVTAKEDEVFTSMLKIEPKSAVASGSSIIIDIHNAEFDLDKIGNFDSKVAYTSGSKSYSAVISDIAARADGTDSGSKYNKAVDDALSAAMGVTTDEIPYEIEYIDKTSIEVKLAPITSSAADNTKVSDGKPFYLIPIVAVVKDDSEDYVTVDIDNNESSITSVDGLRIAKTAAEKGSTTTTISEVKKGTDDIAVDTITVKESVKGTFEQGTVKVRLNGGFKIADVTKHPITIEGGQNLTGSVKVKASDVDDSDSYFTFDIPEAWTNTEKISSFKINGLVVEADDEDKNWGDINITISGSSANITKETIKVAERVDYGFEMTVKDEVPTILSGRTWLANSDLDEDDFESATVEFKETSKDTWITSRKLEFTVPDGVKIVDVEFDETENIHGAEGELEDKAVITSKGTALKINKGLDIDTSDDDGASFEMNLYLSIDADFSGDVTLAVAGGGLAADTLDDVTIATAVTPISVDTTTTSVNMGYQVFDAADITITEAQDGALLDDEEVVLSFDDKRFGNSELGFNDKSVEYSVDGELEIDNFEVNGGEITFNVDKNSYTEPSSITISNITVGTTRSVPYGSYDLKISGDAVVNNYKDKIDDVYDLAYSEIDKEDNEDRAYFDTTDGYSFDNYVNIVTEAGTLDGVVEVTIGEKTIVVNGESVDMDVAPYIQTSSNSTMVPLRFVALALGVDTDKVNDADNTSKIAWDANSKTATILYAAGNGQKIIQFQDGSNYMVVDGTSIPMEYGVTAEITDSRMFVPFRALGQALGVTVDWDADTRTAIYNKR